MEYQIIVVCLVKYPIMLPISGTDDVPNCDTNEHHLNGNRLARMTTDDKTLPGLLENIFSYVNNNYFKN